MVDFYFPPIGPGHYADIGAQIEREGYAKPTMANVASLVHDAFYRQGEQFDEFRKLLSKGRILWVFTGTLYLPAKGVYIQDDPKIVNGTVSMQESELVKKLRQGDPSVRFYRPTSRYDLGMGWMKAQDLAKSRYLIALAGKDGAEQLAEVVSKHKLGNYKFGSLLFSPVGKDVRAEVTRISALHSAFGMYLWINPNVPRLSYERSAFAVAVGKAKGAKNSRLMGK